MERIWQTAGAAHHFTSLPNHGIKAVVLIQWLANENVFHPKLMLMAGTLKGTNDRGLWLSVGSGNLTLSGWAIKREVIGRTVVGQQHAAELCPLVAWLATQAQRQVAVSGPDAAEGKEEGDIREILRYLHDVLDDASQLASDAPDMPTLHLSLPVEGRTPLAMIDDLKGSHPIWRSTNFCSWCVRGPEIHNYRMGIRLRRCEKANACSSGGHLKRWGENIPRYTSKPVSPAPCFRLLNIARLRCESTCRSVPRAAICSSSSSTPATSAARSSAQDWQG
ncbi:hypothetical protein BPA30113_02799 [Burkholderia paludis]|uniref:Uncharacterized protein n=1 Tax=Burkholderia paludis TaxID=1506587 RepID=A0A6J5DRS1_9BURK|nr:hypothetical protein LMG30113_02723 [Burkholderia paludis]VWB62945.1 hypothetical protein BPA30113_02799 [Burkholderia paludis]